MTKKSILSSFEALKRKDSLKGEFEQSAKEFFSVSYEFSRYRNSDEDNIITVSLLTKPNGIVIASYRFELTANGVEPAFYYSNFDNNSLISITLFLFTDLIHENYDVRRDLLDKWNDVRRAIFKKEKEQFYNFIDEKYQLSVEKEIQQEEAPIHLDIILEPYANNTYLVAEYRVGRNKTYSISSPQSFFQRFKKGEKYRYGKELSIIHVLEAFDEVSQAVIKHFMNKATINSRGKYHYLTSQDINDLFEITKGKYLR